MVKLTLVRVRDAYKRFCNIWNSRKPEVKEGILAMARDKIRKKVGPQEHRIREIIFMKLMKDYVASKARR